MEWGDKGAKKKKAPTALTLWRSGIDPLRGRKENKRLLCSMKAEEQKEEKEFFLFKKRKKIKQDERTHPARPSDIQGRVGPFPALFYFWVLVESRRHSGLCSPTRQHGQISVPRTLVFI